MRYSHFSKDERYEISILLKKGYSHHDIAGVLGKDHSSVSREVKNNSVSGKYDPDKAHHKAYVKRKYSKYQGMRIVNNPEIEKYIVRKLKACWSPEQISGRLEFKNNGQSIITFKTIYKYLYSTSGQHLCQYLPSRRLKPKKSKPKAKQEIIKDRVFIDNRPKIIDQRVRCGDFEGDSLGVPRSSKETLAGLVDRYSRYFLAKKITGLKETISAFKTLLIPYHPLSVTLDNGVENIRYKRLNTPTYFCHPYSSWEKGTIENTFKRLRRYVPKKARLENYSDSEISAIIEKMNNTPRKCLGFRTPKEVFFETQQPKLQIIRVQLLTNKCCTSG